MMKRVFFPIVMLALIAPQLSFWSPDRISEEIQIAKEVHTLVNQYRTAKGLRPLKAKGALSEIARTHSEDMAAGRVTFSHDGFNNRLDAVRKYANVPYRVAENLYATYPRQTRIARDAVRDWIKSPGHKENMDGNWIFTGISVIKNRKGEYYITQLFVGKQ